MIPRTDGDGADGIAAMPTAIAAVLLSAVALVLGCGRTYSRPDGPAVAAEPRQEPAEGAKEWRSGRHRIIPLARFSIEALVLHTARYRFDRPAELSPVDLAVGWGPMSDPAVLKRLSVTQDGRWYEYSWSGPAPLPPKTISSHSGNMHMIPAAPAVDSALKSVSADDVVSLWGYLVEVRGDDGWKWRSSLSRHDTGGGSCEVVWVERLEIRRP